MGIFDLFKQLETQQQSPLGPPQFLVVGLGNPGAKYANTRHNTGFILLDMFAEHIGTQFVKHQFQSHVAQGTCEGLPILLMKPDTFMNLSGQAVNEAMRFYHIPPEHVIVIYDDINLPVGNVRIRKKGSDGGHNGMKNIIYLSGSDDFPRIRVGIGQKPHPDYPLADWVLSQFTPADMTAIRDASDRINQAIPLIVQGKPDLAMSRHNSGKPKKAAAPPPASTDT